MPNSTNPNKKKLQVWVDAGLLAQIDGIAARKGVTRAAVVADALTSYASGASDPPATKADLVALAATLTKAIRDQPIAVQQSAPAEALPEPDAVGRAREDGRREGAEAGEAEGREEERRRIAGMSWMARRRYLRG